MTEPAVPYDMIMPSASRPHLLKPVLESYFEYADQKPRRVLVHDDAVFPGKRDEIYRVISDLASATGTPFVFEQHDPPMNHGPSVHWLLQRAETDFVLYGQDDHIVERTLPITDALQVMHEHAINHIRFNKRATMEFKASYHKKAVTRVLADGKEIHLSVSDHWNFQTSLWRRAVALAVTSWWTRNSESFHEHCEVKFNNSLNRGTPEFNWSAKRGELRPHVGVNVDDSAQLPPSHSECMDPDIRETHQRTFIWGWPGEPRYIFHLGDHPDDWALIRGRGGVDHARDSQRPT